MQDPDFHSLLRRLAQAQVQFVLIGGYAAVVHGSPMVTHDLDVGCDFGPENLRRLAQALLGTEPIHRMTPKRVPLDLENLPSAGFKNLYLSTKLGQLDCLSELTGVGPFSAMWNESSSCSTELGVVRVLTLDPLILSKQAPGRARDREAVHFLSAIRAKRARPSE